MTVDTYIGSVFSNCIVAVLFGIFKCTSFAEVLFTTSEVDSQLELKEKHYDKVGELLKSLIPHTQGFSDQEEDPVLDCCGVVTDWPPHDWYRLHV